MGDAARKGDLTSHTVPLDGAGCSNVKIGGKNAWRVGDFHSCKMNNTAPPAPAPIPHIGGSVLKGSFTVLIGSMPAARKGDMVIEPAASPPTVPFPPNNTIQMGEMSVQIGDIAFGLADPAVLKQFCEDWKKLRQDWPNLTEKEREERTLAAVNKALKSAGVPPVDKISDGARKGAKGSFNCENNEIKMPKDFFKGPKGTPAPKGSVGQTLIHEARHAEQHFNAARRLAGAGNDAAKIAKRTGMKQGVVDQAVKNPASSSSAAGQHGAMHDKQKWGGGKAHNDQTRAYSKKKHSNQASLDKAIEAYYGLPNEADARATQWALRDICDEAK